MRFPTLGLAALLLVAGCSASGTARTSAAGDLDDGLPVSAQSGAATSHAESPTPEGPDPTDTPDPALTGEPVPTVPPGDPAGTPEPPREHTDVPEAALLDPATVAAVAGGEWAAGPAASRCLPSDLPGASASRRLELAAVEGSLAQVVASYPDGRSARRAASGAEATLLDCGFAPDRDPRLGDSSAQLVDAVGGRVALVLAAEGAVVVLVAAGSAAARGTWESLADLALGSSCAAAVHGCH